MIAQQQHARPALRKRHPRASIDRTSVRVEFLVRVPNDTPEDAVVYVTGNHAELGEWRAKGLALTPVGGCEYFGGVELQRGIECEFKITLGDWATVEQSADGADLANRRLTTDAGLLLLLTVERWATRSAGTTEPSACVAQGRLRVHQGFGSTRFNCSRSAFVHLPADYDDSSTSRYPVLYLQDGENVFGSESASVNASWLAGETVDRLVVERRIPPIIIVGIESTSDRLNEYTPQYDASIGAGGLADSYVGFVADKLKPFIDATYRTLPDRAHTAIGGSSLGAVAALHACRIRPDVFGGCAAMSPSLWWDNHGISSGLLRDFSWLNGLRLWIDMGTDENGSPDGRCGDSVEVARQFAESIMRRSTDLGTRLHFAEFVGAGHHERWWSRRLDRVLTFLFADS